MNWLRLAKTLTYRVLGIIGTFLVVLIMSGRVDLSLQVGAIDLVLKLVFYYFHELAWEKIKAIEFIRKYDNGELNERK